jgi:hypothetical protein
MTSLSQKNLLALAEKNIAQGQLAIASDNLNEALRLGNDYRIVVKLSQLYRRQGKEDQAYALIKEQPDLFSQTELFQEYQYCLQANHYAIEAEQLAQLLQHRLSVIVEPVSENEQQQLMKNFRQLKTVSQFDYQSLFALSPLNFKNFAQSLLLDPSQDFAVRLSLCEDLVKLGQKEKVTVWILGQKKSFIPAKTNLLEKESIYQEVVACIGDRFRHNPSQLPLMLGEVNLVLGSLYPCLNAYIDEPDSFASDLVSYLERGKGFSHQNLLAQIYQYLPR